MVVAWEWDERCHVSRSANSVGRLPNCAGDVTCYWDQTGSSPLCRKACEKVDSQTTCVGRAACEWDSTYNQCRRLCDLRNQTYCSSYYQCEYYPSLSQCRKTCSYKYTAQPTCDGDPICMWDRISTPGQCRRNCGMYKPSEFPLQTSNQI